MAKKRIIEITEELLAGFLAENGYELYNCEFVKEGRDWFLRVYIDLASGEGYVGTEDCEKVSRFLSEQLDKSDPIEQNYYLEVSSPGMDRPLLKPEHYERYLGEEIEVKLYKGKDGTKKNGICSLLKSRKQVSQLSSRLQLVYFLNGGNGNE